MSAPTIDDVTSEVVAYGQGLVAAATAPLNAEIAQLEAELAAANVFEMGVDPTINRALAGTTLGAQHAATLKALGITGLGRHPKVFDDSEGWAHAQSNLEALNLDPTLGELFPILNAKSGTVADLAPIWDALTEVTGFVWIQEEEAAENKGNVNLAAWRAEVLAIITAARQHPKRALIKVGACGSGYEQYNIKNPAFAYPAQYGGLALDFLGLDVYDSDFDPVTWSPAAVIDPLVAQGKALGCPVAITEFGCTRNTTAGSTDTTAAASARFNAFVAYAKGAGVAWINVWETLDPTGWTLVGKPELATLKQYLPGAP